MIYSHTKYDWFKIDTLKDYLLFTGNFEKLVESELKTIIPLAIANNERELTHNPSKTTYGELFKRIFYMGGGNILDMTKRFDELVGKSKQEQLKAILEGKALHINKVGGWNTAQDFLEDQEGEWVPNNSYWEKFLEKFLIKGEHHTLIIENDTLLSDDMQRLLYDYRKKYNIFSNKREKRLNIIYGYNAIKELDETKAFIQELIKTHGKLNIIIETTNLSDEYIATLKAFAPHINTLYTNQYQVAREYLGDLFEIYDLFNINEEEK